MFPRISVVFVTAVAMFATATPLTTTEPAGQCNTGTLKCCNRVGKGGELGIGGLILSLLGLNANSIVGLSCSLGGPTCNQQPVCCTGDNFNGLIVVGCSPINLNL